MKKNFTIGRSNEVIVNGELFDLHNFYDFGAIELDGRKGLSVFFTPNGSHGSGLPAVTLKFDELDFIELSPGFGTKDIYDMEEIGYKKSTDQDIRWLLSEHEAGEAEHVFIRLNDGNYLRVHSQTAKLEIGGRPKVREPVKL